MLFGTSLKLEFYPPIILFMVPVFSVSLLICSGAYLIILEFLKGKIAVNFK
jgi:hypothetical protein